MKDQKRKQYLLLAASVSILVLYLGSEYVFRPKPYEGGYYLSHSTTSFLNLSEFISEEPTENVSTKAVQFKQANITVRIINTENSERIFKVEYPSTEEAKITRSVFAQLTDINKSEKNVFFIETKCSTEKMAQQYKDLHGFILNARQCCALESTAMMNLNRPVYIFHSCPLCDDFLHDSPKFVERLLSYPNVFVVRLNTTELLLESPLRELQEKKQLEASSYPVEHTSDLLRLVLLWRFGGTYCDLDVVTIRSLNNLKSNWAGMQDSYTIANGVLNFEPEGEGHKMLQKSLEHVNKHYDPSGWSSNGPELITPIILKECNASSVTDAMKSCQGNFTVYPSPTLYPLYYTQSDDFFNEGIGEAVVRTVKQSAYSVHIWNKMSHDKKATVGSKQAYALLADEYCPQVYRSCGTHF